MYSLEKDLKARICFYQKRLEKLTRQTIKKQTKPKERRNNKTKNRNQ